MTRAALAVCAAAAIAASASLTVAAQGQGKGKGTPGGPAFTYQIDFSGVTNACLNDFGTVYVDWTTSRDVNRTLWAANGTPEGDGVAIAGAKAGSDSRTYLFDQTGPFLVEFELWHHKQERIGAAATTINVSNCADVGDCPAAPAIANAYLDGQDYSGGRGPIISAVADAMNDGAFGSDKCDWTYEDAVISFVIGLM